MSTKPVVYFPPFRYELFSDETRPLSDVFDVVREDDLDNNPSLAERVAGIVTPSKPDAVENLHRWIPKFTNIKAIASMAAGYGYPYNRLKEFGIPFAACPSAHTDATADHAMALLLASGCGFMSGIRATLFTDLPHYPSPTYRSPGVCHTTLGIVGLGSIGCAIVERAKGFQMKTLYHSRTRKSAETEGALGVTYYETLNEMLPLCDYVLASCSLTDKTKGLFSEQQFKSMKRSATFINISRGKVVDSDALVNALQTGEILQAALDVTDPEPLPSCHPLLKLNNIIITPHTAAFTSRGLARCMTVAAENLKAAIIDRKKMPNEIKD